MQIHSYNFDGITAPSTTHRASHMHALRDPPPQATSLLTEDAAADQKIVKVTDASIFGAMERVLIQDDNGSEHNWIDIINLETDEITMVLNLSNTYTVEANGQVSLGWEECSDTNYQQLSKSDDDRFQRTSSDTDGSRAYLLCRWKITPDPGDISRVHFHFEGFGESPNGEGAGIRVWSVADQEWKDAVKGSGLNDEGLNVGVNGDIADFVDAEGFLYTLAKTVNDGKSGEAMAALKVDYVELLVFEGAYPVEHPQESLRKLLEDNVLLFRDDGSVADVYVAYEFSDEFFPKYDCVLTTGVPIGPPEKLLATGNQLFDVIYRVNLGVWARSKKGVSGEQMHKQGLAEVKRVLDRFRKRPAETITWMKILGEGESHQRDVKPIIYHSTVTVETHKYKIKT